MRLYALGEATPRLLVHLPSVVIGRERLLRPRLALLIRFALALVLVSALPLLGARLSLLNAARSRCNLHTISMPSRYAWQRCDVKGPSLWRAIRLHCWPRSGLLSRLLRL